MAVKGPLVPIVLIPRFTSYIATTTATLFYSNAIDVSDYVGGTVVAGRGPLVGTSGPGVSIGLEESADATSWHNVVAMSMGGTSDECTFTLSRRWLRVRVAITGTNTAVTCWCAGSLERRIQ